MTRSVFISSRSSLKDLRYAAERAVELLGMKPEMCEHDSARDTPTLKKLDRTIASCDAVLLIAGNEYGWVPESHWGFGADGEKSVTWIEAEIAKSQRKELLAFELSDDDRKNTDALEDAGQQQFKERLRQISSPRTVKTETCAVEMVRALTEWQQRSDLWGVLCRWLSLSGRLPNGARQLSRIALGTLSATVFIVALVALWRQDSPDFKDPDAMYKYGSTQVSFQAGNFLSKPGKFGRVSTDSLAVSAKIDFFEPRKNSLDNLIAKEQSKHDSGVTGDAIAAVKIAKEAGRKPTPAEQAKADAEQAAIAAARAKYDAVRKTWPTSLTRIQQEDRDKNGYWVKKCDDALSTWTDRTVYFLAGIAANVDEDGNPKVLTNKEVKDLIDVITLGSAELCRRAKKEGRESLALPLFGTGAGALPGPDAELRSAYAILRGVNRAAMEGKSPSRVVLVHFPGKEWSQQDEEPIEKQNAEERKKFEEIVGDQTEDNRVLERRIFNDDFERIDDWQAGAWPHRQQSWTLILVGMLAAVLLAVPVFVLQKRLPPQGHWFGATNFWIAMAVVPAVALWFLADLVSTLPILVVLTALTLGVWLLLALRVVVPSAFLPPVYEAHTVRGGEPARSIDPTKTSTA